MRGGGAGLGPSGRPPSLYPRRLPSGWSLGGQGAGGRAGGDAGRPPPLPADQGPGAPSGLGHPPPKSRILNGEGVALLECYEPGVTVGRVDDSGAPALRPVLRGFGVHSWILCPAPFLAECFRLGAPAWGSGKGGLSQRPRSRRTGWGHLPAVGGPQPAALAAQPTASLNGDLRGHLWNDSPAPGLPCASSHRPLGLVTP